MTGPDLDVAIVGDGPAGLALAAECRRGGLAVTVVGRGQPWTATYGMWRDDVPELPQACFGHVSASVVVHARRRHELARPYGVIDDEALRAHLLGATPVTTATATSVQHFRWGSRALTTAGTVDARLVVDATGAGAGLRRPPRGRRATAPAAGQSAFGVVLDAPPPRFDAGVVTLMDLRVLGAVTTPPTFAYVAPVADGWLVEETVLAARPIFDPAALRPRLEARLGRAGAVAVDGARRRERVVIPMGGPLPPRRDPLVAFGAAAGYVHAATGYSVAATLRAAPRVAGAIAAVTGPGATPSGPVWRAVWPPALRRTRLLHDYGLHVLLGLGQNELAMFFDTFFGLPEARWAAYLRIDTPPREVSATMAVLFRRAPASLRWRLVAGARSGGRPASGAPRAPSRRPRTRRR